MTIDRLQKNILKKVVKDDGWDILIQYLNEYITNLNNEEINGSNGFETLRMLHKKQGGVEHLKNFFNNIEMMNFKDE